MSVRPIVAILAFTVVALTSGCGDTPPNEIASEATSAVAAIDSARLSLALRGSWLLGSSEFDLEKVGLSTYGYVVTLSLEPLHEGADGCGSIEFSFALLRDGDTRVMAGRARIYPSNASAGRMVLSPDWPMAGSPVDVPFEIGLIAPPAIPTLDKELRFGAPVVFDFSGSRPNAFPSAVTLPSRLRYASPLFSTYAVQHQLSGFVPPGAAPLMSSLWASGPGQIHVKAFDEKDECFYTLGDTSSARFVAYDPEAGTARFHLEGEFVAEGDTGGRVRRVHGPAGVPDDDPGRADVRLVDI